MNLMELITRNHFTENSNNKIPVSIWIIHFAENNCHRNLQSAPKSKTVTVVIKIKC